MLPPNRFGPPRRPPFYPPQNQTQRPRPFVDYFKTPDGKVDFDKISGSIGQMNKLVGQMNPIFKQISGFLKRPQ